MSGETGRTGFGGIEHVDETRLPPSFYSDDLGNRAKEECIGLSLSRLSVNNSDVLLTDSKGVERIGKLRSYAQGSVYVHSVPGVDVLVFDLREVRDSSFGYGSVKL